MVAIPRPHFDDDSLFYDTNVLVGGSRCSVIHMRSQNHARSVNLQEKLISPDAVDYVGSKLGLSDLGNARYRAEIAKAT